MNLPFGAQLPGPAGGFPAAQPKPARRLTEPTFGGASTVIILNAMRRQGDGYYGGPPFKSNPLAKWVATVLTLLGVAGSALGIVKLDQAQKSPLGQADKKIERSTEAVYELGYGQLDPQLYRQAFCANLKTYGEQMLAVQGKQELSDFVANLALSEEDLAFCQGIIAEMEQHGIEIRNDKGNKYLAGDESQAYEPEQVFARFLDEVIQPRLLAQTGSPEDTARILKGIRQSAAEFAEARQDYEAKTTAYIVATVMIAVLAMGALPVAAVEWLSE